jgi:tetratricopeptide (TPR) repeat protein
LDTVEGFHATTMATVKLYNDDNISVDVVRGKLSVDNKTYCFTPLPPPSIARPNVTRTTREVETSESHDVSPDQEKKLIETATRDLESDNPKRLAETAKLIAELLKQKRNPEAAETLARAMKTYSDRRYGQDHVSAIINSHRLALACKAVGKELECDALLNKTVTLKGNLVDEYLQQRRFAEAASICRQIVDFDNQFLTRADPEAIRDLGLLGTCLYHQGKHAEADEYLGLAADLSELIIGRNNQYTQLVLLDFSNNCVKLGKFDEADEALKKVRMVPENHPHASVIRQAKMIAGKGDNMGWSSKKSRDRAQSASRTSKADGIATPSPASLAKIVEIDVAIAATEGLASGIDSVIQADFDYVSGPWSSEEILVLDKAAISELLYKVLQDDQTAGFRSRSVDTNEGDERQPPYVQLNSIGGTFRPYRIAKRQDGRLVLYGHAALYRAKRALDRAKNPPSPRWQQT